MSYSKIGATVVSLLVLAAACGDDGDDDALIDTVDSGDAPAEETDDGAEETGEGEAPDATSEEAGADPGALLLVMDSSGSMKSRDDSGERLIDLAKGALGQVVEDLPEDQHVGLRVYGHRYPNTDEENGCTDSELTHPVELLDRAALLDSIEGYDAQGFTPIGLSLREGAEDLPPEGQRTMVLVSDGQETCDTDPCQAAQDIAADGVDLVVHTVGFVLDMAAPDEADQARDELSCVAETTGGSFVDVDDAGDLAEAITDVAREERSLEGGELVGSPAPRDASTGAVDTSYTDTVLGVETNYYRFEVEPGTEVAAELTRMSNPDVGEGPTNNLCEQVHVTDVGGQPLASAGTTDSSEADSSAETVTQTWLTDPVRVDTDEVWLSIETMGCGSRDGFPDAEFDVQLRLSVVD